MKRTQQYHDTVVKFRQDLADVWEEYNTKVKRLDKYKGSSGYAKDLQKLQQERDQKIKSLQMWVSDELNGVIKGMTDSATNKSMIAPSAEQIALLQALKMREKISRHELEQAGRTLKDSPVCLSVLQEIAGKMGLRGVRLGAESTESILSHIDSLADSARRISQIDDPGNRGKHMNDQDMTPSQRVYTFRVNRDPVDMADSMEYFGGVEDLPSFESAVND